jgi:alkanesulfonate monooxygenase SsuD/methylene tetrahydromethanopterin reductase-like flavin-dependent oxidoreductase (luciferase family)
MKLGLHLPLMEFEAEGQSLRRLVGAVEAAREAGFDAVSANDHFTFSTPWLDGPTALAAVVEHAGTMTLATTIALVSLRGPTALAKTLAALDVLSGGRVIAGVGPGSSKLDYNRAAVSFEDRWPRFDAAVVALREQLGELEPRPVQPGGIPIWIGSWGSPAGLRRVTRLADGWLASAYNTTPAGFATARAKLPAAFPNAIATMWTWVTDDDSERRRMLEDVLGPILRRDMAELADRLCIGPPEHCARILSDYAAAGCECVYFWPLGDEPRQVERIATEVVPMIRAGAMAP